MFKPKQCRYCSKEYIPTNSSNLYCSSRCAEDGVIQRHFRKSYGLTYSEVIELREKQNNLCAICDEPGFLMNDRVKSGLNVDHNHKTGEVRGLLCHNCNRGLGLFKDNTDRLKRAIDYLEGATTISQESTAKWLEAPDSES